MDTPNLRTMTVDQSKAKDVSQTSQLSGNAKPTGKLGDSNKTVEYSVSAPGHEGLGGRNLSK